MGGPVVGGIELFGYSVIAMLFEDVFGDGWVTVWARTREDPSDAMGGAPVPGQAFFLGKSFTFVQGRSFRKVTGFSYHIVPFPDPLVVVILLWRFFVYSGNHGYVVFGGHRFVARLGDTRAIDCSWSNFPFAGVKGYRIGLCLVFKVNDAYYLIRG